MNCKCASYHPDIGRWQCSVSGSECMYLLPNSKRCAIDYQEGPDADRDPVELLAELETEQQEYEAVRQSDDDYWDDEE